MKYLSPKDGYNIYYKEYKKDYKHLDSFDWDISFSFIKSALTEQINLINKQKFITNINSYDNNNYSKTDNNNLKNELKILDIGCGDGRVLKRIKNLNKSEKFLNFTFYLYGIDVSDNMLRLAKKRIKEGVFLNIDIEQNIFSNINNVNNINNTKDITNTNSTITVNNTSTSNNINNKTTNPINIKYNLIISFFLLVHIKNLDQFFHNIYSLLEKRGIFIFNNIPQKSAPVLKSINKKFIIKYYNHSNYTIEEFLHTYNFDILQKKEIFENNTLISTVYKVSKY